MMAATARGTTANFSTTAERDNQGQRLPEETTNFSLTRHPCPSFPPHRTPPSQWQQRESIFGEEQEGIKPPNLKTALAPGHLGVEEEFRPGHPSLFKTIADGPYAFGGESKTGLSNRETGRPAFRRYEKPQPRFMPPQDARSPHTSYPVPRRSGTAYFQQKKSSGGSRPLNLFRVAPHPIGRGAVISKFS